MSLQYRKSKSVGNGARLNVSQRGLSVSKRVGPLSVSSRGNMSFRLAPGLSFRTSGKKGGGAAGMMLAFALVLALLWAAKVTAVLVWRFILLTVWVCRWVWFAAVGLAGRIRDRKPDGSQIGQAASTGTGSDDALVTATGVAPP